MMTSVPLGSSNVPGTGDSAGPARERYAAQLEAPGFNGRFNQGVGSELIAQQWNISRAQLDEYSVASHERAAAAQDAGAFDAEIAPFTLADGTVFSPTRASAAVPRPRSSGS